MTLRPFFIANLKLAGPSKVLTSRQFVSAKMLVDFHDDKRLDAGETLHDLKRRMRAGAPHARKQTSFVVECENELRIWCFEGESFPAGILNVI